MALKLRRGTDAERQLITPEAGEPLWIDNEALWIGDGSTVGGIKVTGGIENDLATVSIDALSDVDTTSSAPTNGQTLIWNTNKFEPGLPALTINDLSNVDVVSNPPSNGDSLIWNGASWVPGAPTFSSGGLISGYLLGDVRGSVFSDGSDTMIDGLRGKIVGSIETTDFITVNRDIDVMMRMYGTSDTGVTGPRLEFNTSDGTVAAPTAVSGGTTGTHLAEFRGLGYDGTDFVESGLVRVSVDLDQTVSTGVVPGRVVFITADNSGNLANIMTFNSAGKLGVGTPRPTEKLHVSNGNAKIDGFVQFGSLTTTERNALTAAAGMVIWNSTTSQFEGFDGTNWINLVDGITSP